MATVTVDRVVALSLMKQLGGKGTDSWTDARLIGRLAGVHKSADVDTEVEGKKEQKLLKEILKAGADAEFEIKGAKAEAPAEAEEAAPAKGKGKKAKAEEAEEADEEEEDGDEEETEDADDADDEEEKPAKGKKTKADKDKAEKAEKPAKAKKPEAKKDALGCREGSQAAKINAALPKAEKKHKAADKIAEESGCSLYRVKSHLAAMVNKKLVEHTDDGYRLAAAKK